MDSTHPVSVQAVALSLRQSSVHIAESNRSDAHVEEPKRARLARPLLPQLLPLQLLLLVLFLLLFSGALLLCLRLSDAERRVGGNLARTLPNSLA